MTPHTADSTEEISLERLIPLLLRAIRWALPAALLSATVTYFALKQQPLVYESASSLVAVQPGPLGSAGSFTTPLVSVAPLDPQAYKEAALSTQVLGQALAMAGEPEGPQALMRLRQAAKVRTVDGRQSSIITLRVRDRDPARAARLANAWAAALRGWEDQRAREHFTRYRRSVEAQLEAILTEIRQARQLKDPDRLRSLDALRGNLARDRDLAHALEESAVGLLALLEHAQVPLAPSAPRPLLGGAAAAVIASLLFFGFVLLREALVRAVRDSEEAARVTGLPVLGEFPRMPPNGKRELPAEAAAFLRTGVHHALADRHPKVVLVTSPEKAEGKSSVAIALARAYARADLPTLLVDADLRRPVVHREFGIAKGWDLVESLRDFTYSVHAHPVAPNLEVLPCLEAPENPAELLAEHWRDFLNNLVHTGRYKVVVVDSPPALAVSDALILAPHASGVLVAVSEGATDRKRLEATLEVLSRVGARVVGLAMTNLRRGPAASGQFTYGYGYGYGPVAVADRKEHKGLPKAGGPKSS
ncbi:Tyrosine-protein kinase ptk [Calidithermus terrae]|uniref:Tyrosine-protein kinase ptk n=1 Tax=Calidithermus terrae TaxID=1408545 RepID=A0A399EFN2_9DEIN|nr:polysaccharide biosynthesis tyrosine autokinase [Calidithermus terrae]RIH82546.1 Tyrosine-protein kinase ptk [Calidithermus terrae]